MNGVIWFTGLSGSGKTTLARALADKLMSEDALLKVLHLDGDELRKGLCNDLSMSMEDRAENVRRAAEVARIASRAGMLVIVSMITPLFNHREIARGICFPQWFQLLYVSTPLDECRRRDVKGIYSNGTLGVSGLDSPYEEPTYRENRIIVPAHTLAVSDCLLWIMGRINHNGIKRIRNVL